MQAQRNIGAIALMPALLLAGCRSSEQELIDRYFSASSRRDNSTVAALSMVAFTAEFSDWSVLEIRASSSEPYEISALVEAVAAAEDIRDSQFKEFGRFRQENYDELARIQRQLRENPEHQFTGRLGELSAAWEAFRGERREVVASLQEAELELERAIRRVEKSLQRESTPEYLTGSTLHKRARVRVTTPSGDVHYLVTLTRYELTNQFDAVVPARWIITAVEPES